MSYSADRRGGRFAAVLSSATAVGDLHIIDVSSPAAPKKLTGFNDALFGELTVTDPEEIWYTSFDGTKIQGWILKPPGFEPSKKYPLILQIHGGPHSAYGNTFTHEFHWMAAKGYVVLYTNPRGSSNYGQDFGNSIQFRYPGDDYKDLMAGVDEILKKGYIDEGRMGVTGGSGGGLLTNWVVTQTNRFKAAVSQRDISDWANFWYTADFTLFTPTVVPQGSLRRPGGLRRALSDHARGENPDAADVHPRGRRLANAAGRRRRGPLPRPQVPQASDRDGPLSERESRTVARRQAVAPRGAPPAHRRLVRPVAPRDEEPRLHDYRRRGVPLGSTGFHWVPPGSVPRGSQGSGFCRFWVPQGSANLANLWNPAEQNPVEPRGTLRNPVEP